MHQTNGGANMIPKIIFFLYRKIRAAQAYFWTAVLYRPMFGALGKKSIIIRPTLISNPIAIKIGDHVRIRDGVRLEVVYDGVNKFPQLTIGNNTNIEQNVHIVCHCRISIGERVSITANCAIVDTIHPFEDVADPRKIGDRIDTKKSFVVIGDDCFLGIGAIILPNVTIGHHSIIGSNAVVTRDVPPYAIVRGKPAKLGRRLITSDPDLD